MAFIRFNRVNGFFIQFAPANCFFTVFTVINTATSHHLVMFLCRNKDSITALTEILMASHHLETVTAFRLLTDNTHNIFPFNTMWFRVNTINVITNKMCGFVAGSVVDECVTVGMKHIIVECNFVAVERGIPCTATLELEADRGQREISLVKL